MVDLNEGDFIFDGSTLFMFEALSQGKIHLKLEGSHRVYNLKGTTFYRVPPEKVGELVDLLAKLESVKKGLLQLQSSFETI